MSGWKWEGGVNTMRCPCKGCAAREVGCHGKCEQYGAWKAEMAKKRQAEKLYAESMRTMSEDSSRWLTRANAKKNKKKMHRSYDT